MSVSTPVAKIVPKNTVLHGKALEDPYSWLRDKESADTLEYLAAENRYTEADMAGTQSLQQRLYEEMLSHLKQTDEAVPYLKDGYYYVSRTEEGKQYPILCRRRGSLDAPEQVILDINALAEGQAFMSLGSVSVSDDGRWLAYTTDNVGFRQYTLHIRNLDTGHDLTDTAVRVGSIAWAADNSTLFYTQEDEIEKRQHRLYRHTRGSNADELVFEEPDERFNLEVGRTRSRALLLLHIHSHTTSELRFLSAQEPQGNWRTIEPRRADIEYTAEERHGVFYIRANDTARTFRLVTAPVNAPGAENWQEIIAAQPDIPLEDVEVFENFYVVEERVAGLPRLRVVQFDGGDERGIAFPDPAYAVFTASNAEFRTDKLRYAYQSLVTPSSVYDYDVRTGESELRKRTEIPGGFDPALYSSERVFATAEDGTKIPVSLVYRKDKFERDGTNPLYVYGYGSYGYALPIGFNGNRLSLLDRGVVIAYAHIRGGGDLGQPWHDAGRMMVKRNTFTDFIACVEHLVAEKYGDRDRIAIEGGSAGGLLMGAVVNLRPDLFRAVVSHVPFVDVMNTMLDASLPLTVPEYEEWGNPNEREAFGYMLSYSPYDNLKAGAYPAMLVKTSLHDSQVMYWEPAKYVAKLRTLKTNDTPLLLHINMTAGHGGASGRYDYLKEIAFDYAFVLRELGVEA